ncbi:MAG: MATE family efflux transporter [Oscillospiraceae bacterium]|nr:MATE family efflux transporter [Oscillospiraceae bacterium]
MQKFKNLLSSVNMTEGMPWKKLLLFTIPLLIGNLFQQLYSTADAIILGRYVGDNALAAVGSSMPIFFLIIVLIMGISVGAGIMVSQYFGAKKYDELSYTIGNSLTIVTILGAVMMLLGPLGTRPLLTLLNTPPEILNDSILYMNILLWGVLGMAYFNILSAILRGLGDAFSPLIYLAIASVLNIILNYLFIVGFGWGVPAVAVGTVIAQGFSSVLCFIRLHKMKKSFKIGLQYMRPKKVYSNKILKLGIPTGASHAIFAIAAMIVQPLVNSFGASIIAANVIVMRIDGFVLMPIFSFSNAMTVFAGQNMGAGKIDRIAKGTKQCALMSAGTAVIMAIIVLTLAEFIAGTFTQTQEVIDTSRRMLLILSPGYIALSLAMVYWGTVRGAGDAISPLWASFVNTVIVRVPAAYLFVHWFGTPEAIMYGLLVAWISNVFLAFGVYRIGKWRKKGLVD